MCAKESIAEKAERLHNEGFNCAETVLKIATEQWGIKDAIIPKIATAFGGGIGRKGSACGALTGGVMAIGARFGRSVGSDTASRDRSYALGLDFAKWFEKEFGSLICYDLIQCDLTTPEGREKQRAMRKEKCSRFITRAAQGVLDLVQEKAQPGSG